jgi:hypothetical protein
MKSAPPTSSQALIDEVAGQVKSSCPAAVVEAIAAQLYLAREARQRVASEGSVVRDPKGSVIAHPAIKIEAAAVKLYSELLSKWAKR